MSPRFGFNRFGFNRFGFGRFGFRGGCFGCGFGWGFGFGLGFGDWWDPWWPSWGWDPFWAPYAYDPWWGWPGYYGYGYPAIGYNYNIEIPGPYSGSSDDNSSSYESAPALEGSPNTNPPTGNMAASTPTVLLYLKDGTMFVASDYWLKDGRLHYYVNYGGENEVEMDQLDLQRTVDENSKRGVRFSLKPHSDSTESVAPAPATSPSNATPATAPAPVTQPTPQTQSASQTQY
ncbi:MAG: hypothetical protein WBP79_13135 [Candidatus Acidiferrales bacterium]